MQPDMQVCPNFSNDNEVLSKTELPCCRYKIWKSNCLKFENNNKLSVPRNEIFGDINLSKMYHLNYQNSDFALEAFYPYLLTMSSQKYENKNNNKTSNIFSGDNSQLVNENMKRYRKSGIFLSPSQIPKDNERQTIIMNFSEMLRTNLEDSEYNEAINDTESQEKKNLTFRNKTEEKKIQTITNFCEEQKRDLIVEPVSEKTVKNSSMCLFKDVKKFQKTPVCCKAKNCNGNNNGKTSNCNCSSNINNLPQDLNKCLPSNNSKSGGIAKSLWFIPNYPTVNYLYKSLDFVLGAQNSSIKSMSKNQGPELQASFAEAFSPKPLKKTFIAIGTNGITIVSNYLESLGWHHVMDKHSQKYFLKWVENRNQINYKTFREGEQMVNHLPSTCHLSNKIHLLNLLRELNCHHRPGLMKLSDVIPETFRIDLQAESEAFQGTFKDGDVWICKPATLNQGKGIFLIRQLSDVEKYLTFPSKENNKLPSRIIQRYIHKPLLLEGRKADIRSYMLIASTAPFLIVFNPGYVRLSCMKYDIASDDMGIHLTNQCMQKKDPQYISIKESTVWSIQQLNDYVNKNIAPEKNLKHDWVFSSFLPKMRRAMLHCFIAAKSKLESRVGYFELLGFDFLIDENLKVWLLEINVNPSFATNCYVLQDVVPAVIKESLDISIECFEKNRYNIPLLPLQRLKNFSLLYCGENISASPSKKTTPKQMKLTSKKKKKKCTK